MSTDLETLLTLAAAGNLPATTDYLMSLPHELRADALVHAITDLILDRNPIMVW